MRRLWPILTGAMIAAALVLVISLSFPTRYTATSGLTIRLPSLAPETRRLLDSGGNASGQDDSFSDGVLEAQPGPWIVAVRRRAAGALGLDEAAVARRVRLLTSKPRRLAPGVPGLEPIQMTIEATDADAKRAAVLANGFAAAYLSSRSTALQTSVDGAQRALQRRRSLLGTSPRFGRRRAELQSQARDLEIMRSLEAANVVARRVSQGPVLDSPHPLRNTILAAVLGAMAGAWLFARRRRPGRSTPQDRDDLARKRGVALL